MFNFDQILVHRGEAIDDFATSASSATIVRAKTKSPGRIRRPGISESKQPNVDQYSQTLTVRSR
jgi:hypothetical protein